MAGGKHHGAQDVEVRLQRAVRHVPQEEQFRAGRGSHVVIPQRGVFFHGGGEHVQKRVPFLQFKAQGTGQGKDVAFAPLLRHQHALGVPHQGGVNVLVQGGVLHDGAHMHAPLVGEGGVPHKGLPPEGGQVGHFRNEGGGGFEARQGGVTEAGKALHLQLKVGNDGAQVGVSAAFPDAVHGALHLDGPAVHGGQAVGDGQLAVIVGVDAQGGMRKAFPDRPDDGTDFLRHGASVGIAQDQAVRAVLMGGAEHGQGVFRVPLEAVKKVFRVKKSFFQILFKEGDGVADDFQIAFPGDAQRHFHMAGAGFPEDGGHPRAAGNQGVQRGVRLRRTGRMVRAAEGGQLRIPELHVLHGLEKFRLHRVGAGPAALNVVHAQIIQLPGDADLVRRTQVDVFTLRSIAQRGIIEENFGGHRLCSYMQTRFRSRPGPGFSPDADTKSTRLEGGEGFR